MLRIIKNKKLKKQKFNDIVINSKWIFFIFQLQNSNSKCNILFFNFELVNRKWYKKSLTFELVIRSETTFFNFELVTRKQKKLKFNLWVGNSKFDLIFYKVKLITRKNNFSKYFRVSNLKCEVILRNSV